MKSRYLAILFFLFVTLILVSRPGLATEGFYRYQTTQAGGLVTKLGEKDYEFISLPTEPGLVLLEDTHRFYYREGVVGLGFEKRGVTTFDYNLAGGQFLYYALAEEALPSEYTDIDLSYTRYTREDILLDLLFASSNWKVELGCRLIRGTDVSRFEVREAVGANSTADNALLQYSLQGLNNFWTSNSTDIAMALAGHFQVEYQPTEQIKLTLSGDDLGSQLIWRTVNEYHGIIDLDVVKEDEQGIPTFHAPLRGDYFAEDGFLRVRIPAKLRAQLEYDNCNYWLENWISHYYFWEWGTTVGWHRNQDYFLGVRRQGARWLYNLGIGGEKWRLSVATNNILAEPVTNLFIDLQLSLM